MTTLQTVTLVLPDHTSDKLGELQAHYLMPRDMILQKVIVDRVDDIHEAVILEPRRKAAVDK